MFVLTPSPLRGSADGCVASVVLSGPLGGCSFNGPPMRHEDLPSPSHSERLFKLMWELTGFTGQRWKWWITSLIKWYSLSLTLRFVYQRPNIYSSYNLKVNTCCFRALAAETMFINDITSLFAVTTCCLCCVHLVILFESSWRRLM